MSGSLRLPRPLLWPPPPPWLPVPWLPAAVAAAATTVAPAAAVVVVGAVAAAGSGWRCPGRRGSADPGPAGRGSARCPVAAAWFWRSSAAGCPAGRGSVAPVLLVRGPGGCRRPVLLGCRSCCGSAAAVALAVPRSCGARWLAGSSSCRSLSCCVGPCVGRGRSACLRARARRRTLGLAAGLAVARCRSCWRRRRCSRWPLWPPPLGGLDGLDEVALAHPGGLDAEPAGELLELGEQHGVQAALAGAGRAGAPDAGAVSVDSVIRGPSPSVGCAASAASSGCCGGSRYPVGTSGHTDVSGFPAGGVGGWRLGVRRLRSVLGREAGRDAQLTLARAAPGPPTPWCSVRHPAGASPADGLGVAG